MMGLFSWKNLSNLTLSGNMIYIMCSIHGTGLSVINHCVQFSCSSQKDSSAVSVHARQCNVRLTITPSSLLVHSIFHHFEMKRYAFTHFFMEKRPTFPVTPSLLQKASLAGVDNLAPVECNLYQSTLKQLSCVHLPRL
jgi:hypothetical protein